MSERRPHWDTELEQSVSAILFDCYNNGVSEEQVYQAIAAVEDWVLSAPIFDLYLSRKHAPDKAAIARVRDMCDTIVKNSHRFQDAWDEDPTAAQVPYGQAMVARHILQALDGERDE